jgi:O-antigen ligase
MPEYLKALTVILVLALSVFLFAKSSLAAIIPVADFNRRRNLWFFLTALLFLSHSFWLYIVIGAVAVFLATVRDGNKVAAFFFVLFAIPPISALVPGFGIVNVLFSIDYLRLLTLVLLMPLLFDYKTATKYLRFPESAADKYLLAYLLLLICLAGLVTTFTDLLRNAFNLFVDIFLPYYAASRTLTTATRFRDAIGAFVIAATIMAPIGLFELIRSWALYSSLASILDVQWAFFGYLLRDGGLRADAAAGQPIVLGYVMVVAIGFFLYVQKYIQSRARQYLLLIALVGGLIAPLSRGPWIGAVVLFLVFLVTGRYSAKKLVGLATGLAVSIGAISLTPYAAKLVSYIPFVGAVDNFNVTYRQLLIQNCISLIKGSPFFGVPNALGSSELQAMRQGQGIIDIVNTYVAVALGSGLVGLTLFLGVFLSVGFGLLKAIKQTKSLHTDLNLLGRVLLAVLCAILVMIGTVSSILSVALIYWMVAGMGVAYLDLVRRTLAAPSDVAPISPSDEVALLRKPGRIVIPRL